MKVFVTGGTGFVGRYVVRELLKNGHSVHLGVRNPEKARSLFGDEVEVSQVNFMDRSSIKNALSQSEPEAVIHLIGILQEVRRKGITFENVHYLYSANLFDCAKEFGVDRVVYMSALGTDDFAPSRYHQTKRLAERELMDLKLRYTIFRPSLILGPEQKLFSDMDDITRKIPVVALPGGGTYRFQPVDVRDVAQCFAKSLESEETEGKIYELCGDRRVSFKELLEDIFSFWNRKVYMIPLPTLLMYYMGKVIETFIQPPPFSSDQMLMMWKDNVCGLSMDVESKGVEKVLGRSPTPYRESIVWALEGYSAITSSSR